MDFKPMKKDGKPDENGHFPWERPALRKALDEARKGAAPKTAGGLTPITWQGTSASAPMIARDLPKKVAAEQRAEGECAHLEGTFIGIISGLRKCRTCKGVV